MQDQSLIERIADALNQLSIAFGSEGGGPVILLVILGLATLLLGIGVVVLYSSSRRRDEESRLARLEGLLGRFERTERTLNEFRAEALRHLEISRGELEYMRSEFELIRELIEAKGINALSAPDLDSKIVEHPSRERQRTRPESTGFKPIEELTAELSKTQAKVGSETQAEQEDWKPTEQLEPMEEVDSDKIPSSFSDIKPSEPAPEPLSQRLKKSRVGFFEKIRSVFSGKPKLDEDAVADLEAILVSSDLGIKTASSLLDELKTDVKSGAEISEGGLAGILKYKLLTILEHGSQRGPIIAPRRREDGPVVVLIVGVNGAGKTTTVAKLAHQWKNQGSQVLMVAADTFRAAAVEQLHEWGRRLGIPVISGAPQAKPQTVVFDALVRAKQEPVDVVIIDTAGRLHTKQNLMDELEGIRNAVSRHFPAAPDEVILVVDGSTGQNAISQAREFDAATKLTGLVVTKLDGTSKGGVVVAIKEELGIPIRYIGVGEGQEDLRPFVARDFVEAILGGRADDSGESSTTRPSSGPISTNAAIRRQRRAEG